MIQNKYAQLSILSILHFLVDFICVGWVIFWCKTIYEEDINFFLLFNYCCFAFLSQPFFGNYIDKLLERKNKDISKSVLLISASLILIGFAILSIVNPDAFYSRFPVIFIGVAFLGLGNSLFHIIGGKLTLSMSSKATFGGIFVSTGAIGVGLGTGIVYFTYTPTVTFCLAPFMYALGCLLMCFLIKDDKADIDDILSESFIKAMESRETIKKPDNIKSFPVSIARNKALDFLKKNHPIPCSDTIEELYGEEDKTSDYLSSIEPLLSSKETIIIYLKIAFSYTWDEIVEETGIPNSTARKLYDQAMEKLRKGVKL